MNFNFCRPHATKINQNILEENKTKQQKEKKRKKKRQIKNKIKNKTKNKTKHTHFLNIYNAKNVIIV